MQNPAHKQIIIWLLTGCALVAAMVVIGGITRLTGSGLSITEWNLLMGAFPPVSQEEWMHVFLKYQQSPQFLKVNFNMSLPEFKAIFWWEYLHRLLGRIIGIVFIIPFLYFLVKGKFREKALVRNLIILFLLGGFQGFLGWFMVKSGLQYNPHVSHYRLAAHLITAFMLYGFTFIFALDLMYPSTINEGSVANIKKIKVLTRVFFVVLIVQIIYGAFVAGLKAGRIYNTWPKMAGRWIPEGLDGFHPLWLNIFENLTAIQFIHRTIALVLVCLGGFIIFYSVKPENKTLVKPAIYIGCALLLQFLLGIFTLLYSVPLTLAALHQTGALLLFTTVLFFMHRLNQFSRY
jgi:cytochrome c oxidase assembly protein subunit 15